MSGGDLAIADPTGDDPAVSTTRGEQLLGVEDLRKYYDEDSFMAAPVKALDGVSLSIDRGETVAIVGESGSGKTTLGRCLARLDHPSSGRISFDGEEVTHADGRQLRQYRRHCQLLFQDPDRSLNDRLTVGQIVSEPLAVHDWGTAAERRERTLRLLDAVGLKREHYARYPHQFSGGQRQRVAIARALALGPELLVLDEPVSALDVSVQAQILRLLADLQDEFDLTYLLITHDLGVVRTVADRMLVMYLGHVMERGPTNEVFTDPANPYTKALLSAIPEPDPTIDLDPIGLQGSPPDPRSPPSGCPFATRCPMKIRDETVSTAPTVQTSLDRFREVLRERAEANPSLLARVRRLFGRSPDPEIETVRTDLFAELDGVDSIEPVLDDVVATYQTDGPTAALDRFDESFGSVCDEAVPPVLSTDRQRSRCHRHRDEYDPPDAVDPRA